MALDLSVFKAKKIVRFYSGKTQVKIGDFLDDEVVQVSLINPDGVRESIDVVFSMDLVNTLQKAIDEDGYRSVVIFKK